MDTEFEIPPALDKVLDRIVNSIVKKEKFVNYTAVKKPLSLKGFGYLSVPHTIHIKGTTNEGEKELNIFTKVRAANNEVTFMIFPELFETESFVYTKLFKVFTQLQDEAKVPAEERYRTLKGYDESNDEAIVLENAIIKGYRTRTRMEIPPIQSVELSMKQIAKLHALGYVLKTKMPTFYEEEITHRDFPLENNENFKKFASNLVKLASKNLPLESKEKVESFLPTLLEKFLPLINEKTPLDTFSHGDFRPPNILVKEQDGEVKDVILIDYQMINGRSPVNDLIFYVYLYSDRAFRSQHLSRLIDLYYSNLTDFLRYFKIDVNDVCPRVAFDESMKERHILGLMTALFYYPLFYAPENHVPDVSEDIGTYNSDLDPEILERLSEIVEDYIDVGVL